MSRKKREICDANEATRKRTGNEDVDLEEGGGGEGESRSRRCSAKTQK